MAAIADQRVYPAIADDGVVELIAGAAQIGGTNEVQLLYIGSQRVAEARIDRVIPLTGLLHNDVSGIVDHIAVVAGTTSQYRNRSATI